MYAPLTTEALIDGSAVLSNWPTQLTGNVLVHQLGTIFLGRTHWQSRMSIPNRGNRTRARMKGKFVIMDIQKTWHMWWQHHNNIFRCCHNNINVNLKKTCSPVISLSWDCILGWFTTFWLQLWMANEETEENFKCKFR